MARILDQLKGHQGNLNFLLEAQARGRLAATLIFAGPAGIGKRQVALALAQSLVCDTKTRGGCGECGPCLRVEKGQSESLKIVAPDGHAIKIEQAREVLEFTALRKMGHARIIIFDQVHLLNSQAANALLKLLEEPPAGTYFILITSLAASLLATIRSRSQLVRFCPLTSAELSQVLGADIEPWIIKAAQGSVEAAQRMLENREEFVELQEAAVGFLSAARERFPSEEVARLKELLKERSSQAYVAGLIQGVVRDGLRAQSGLDPVGQIAAKAPRLKAFKDLMSDLATRVSARELGILAEKSFLLELDMARNVDRGLVLETFAIDWRRAQA